MRKIVFGRNEYEVTISAAIADEDRQALAYSMLCHMMDNGASITVGKKTIPLEKNRLWLMEQGNDVETRMKHSPDTSVFEGQDVKVYTKPRLDIEFFGANGHLFEQEEHLYSTACVSDDGTLVQFMPMTVSYDKANEMNNFMLQGLDPSVSISYPQDGKMIQIVNGGKPVHGCLINENGQPVTEHHDRDWTTGKASDSLTEIRPLMYDRKYEIIPEDSMKVSNADYRWNFEQSKGYGSGCPDITVHRIRALRDFGDVKAGDLGGYVESENNLSHSGSCWIYDNAAACCDAVVRDDATMRGEAKAVQAVVISGNANVFGEARICDNAVVCDSAEVGFEWDGTVSPNGKWKNGSHTQITEYSVVSGNAKVLGEVIMSGNAKISGDAYVEGKWPHVPDDKYLAYYITEIGDNAVIDGNAKVLNAYVNSNAHIHGNAEVSGHQKMGGHVDISGNAEICGDAKISHNIVMNGNAKISGSANISDKIIIGRDADIRDRNDYFALKTLGKNTYAVRNSSDGVTIVHKGNAYHNTNDLKMAVNYNDPKIAGAIDALEEKFGFDQGFADAVASISTDNPGLKQ